MNKLKTKTKVSMSISNELNNKLEDLFNNKSQYVESLIYQELLNNKIKGIEKIII